MLVVFNRREEIISCIDVLIRHFSTFIGNQKLEASYIIAIFSLTYIKFLGNDL